MKKLTIGFLLVMLVATCSLSIYAERDRHRPGGYGPGPGGPGPGGPGPGPGMNSSRQLRDDARYTIHRTAQVVAEAQRIAKRHRSYNRFGLGLAVAHQERATDLYRQGDYQFAIYHSLRARRLAFSVFDNNRYRWGFEYQEDRREDYYGRRRPSDDDLDRRLDRRRVRRDDDVIRILIKFDLD